VSSSGYGHITTKTTQGKIATILYSAFGVPLMMLFVANIGSTMARMFAFVFSRITMIFCCRWNTKRKRTKRRRRQNLPSTSIILDGQIPIEKIHDVTTKSNLKRNKDEQDTNRNSR
jgi:potassium channel subfamily K member 18